VNPQDRSLITGGFNQHAISLQVPSITSPDGCSVDSLTSPRVQNPLVVDALSLDWTDLHSLYAFPPTPLLPSILHMMGMASCMMILVASDSDFRTWSPLRRDMAIAPPWPVPMESDLLSHQMGTHRFLHLFLAPLKRTAHFIRSFEDRALSPEVNRIRFAARRESTRKKYEAKWSIF